jgi:hypothetical protein
MRTCKPTCTTKVCALTGVTDLACLHPYGALLSKEPHFHPPPLLVLYLRVVICLCTGCWPGGVPLPPQRPATVSDGGGSPTRRRFIDPSTHPGASWSSRHAFPISPLRERHGSPTSAQPASARVDSNRKGGSGAGHAAAKVRRMHSVCCMMGYEFRIASLCSIERPTTGRFLLFANNCKMLCNSLLFIA